MCYSSGVCRLSKAFDSVNHQLLLKKLPGYGINNHELRWFKNYLTSPCQSVVYGSAKSAPQQIKSCVPQGSILGPILFSIYFNDLPNCLLQSKILLYADDAVLFYADSNIGNISTVLNKDLKQLQSWTHFNKLCIHPVKTEYVLSALNSESLRLPCQMGHLAYSSGISR